MKLEENMRIRNSGNDPKLVEFDDWLQQLGDGKLPSIDEIEPYIVLPQSLSVEINENEQDKQMQDAIEFTFGNIEANSASPTWRTFVSSRAILATTNNYANDINKLCLNQLPGEEIIIPSVDSTVNPDDATHYPVEYITSLQTAGIPPHQPTLKKGADGLRRTAVLPRPVQDTLRQLNLPIGLI